MTQYREARPGVSETRTAVRPETEKAPHISYLPGIDGLRAVAVMAVLFYHAELPWMAGGYLGVEVFFVLSGYLITSLLLAEWGKRGTISLTGFWARRARRLLPALFSLIVATLAFSVLFLPDQVTQLRGDAVAASTYVTNWYLVFNQRSYFEMIGRPPLLQHLWSLAVEEQFYVLWPLLFLAGMRLFRSKRAMLLAVLAAIAASSGLMALLYQPDADPSRVYYGTDTRASALLIGCALALVWMPVAGAGVSPAPSRLFGPLPVAGRRLMFDLAGFLALGGLVYLFVWLDETQSFLYQGGFLVTALFTAALIAVLVQPFRGLLSGMLGSPLPRWAGTRSYSIYLWHWPVFSVTRPQLDIPVDGVPLMALRLAIIFGLAELSYRLVETPVRKGALQRAWRRLRDARGVARKQLATRWGAAAGITALLSLLLGVAVVTASPPATPSYLVDSDPSASGQAGSSQPSVLDPGSTGLQDATDTPVTVVLARGATDTPLPPTKQEPTETATPAAPLPPSPTAVIATEPPPAVTPEPTLTPQPPPVPSPTVAFPATAVLPTALPTEVIAAAPTATETPPPSTATAVEPTGLREAPTDIAAVDTPDSTSEASLLPGVGDGTVEPDQTAVESSTAGPALTEVVTSGPVVDNPADASSTSSVTAAPTQAETIAIAPAIQATPVATQPADSVITQTYRGPIYAIGDSVMLGAVKDMKKAIPGIVVDAALGRQASTGTAILKARRDAGLLGDLVIVHLGSNGYFTAKQFDDMMKVLANVRLVVFIDNKVPRRWESPNNSVIISGVSRYPNTMLIDWRGASINHPEFFYNDAIHLKPAGAQFFASLVASSIGLSH